VSRYYAFVNGNVAGPYEAFELQKILKHDLQVCAEGSDEWSAAENVQELAVYLTPAVPPPFAPASVTPPPFAAQQGAMPFGPFGNRTASSPFGSTTPVQTAPPVRARPNDQAPKDLPPKLRELWIICRNAPDELLQRQKKEFWKKYLKNEQKILEMEIIRRGLKN